MGPDSQRNSHQGESQAGERKGRLTVNLHLNRGHILHAFSPTLGSFVQQLPHGHLAELGWIQLGRAKIGDWLNSFFGGDALPSTGHLNQSLEVAQRQRRRKSIAVPAQFGLGSKEVQIADAVGEREDANIAQQVPVHLAGIQRHRTQFQITPLSERKGRLTPEHRIAQFLEGHSGTRAEVSDEPKTHTTQHQRKSHHRNDGGCQANASGPNGRQFLVGTQPAKRQQRRRQHSNR